MADWLYATRELTGVGGGGDGGAGAAADSASPADPQPSPQDDSGPAQRWSHRCHTIRLIHVIYT